MLIRPQLDKQTRFIITFTCLGFNASESVNEVLCSAVFLLQEGLYRKRSHLAARSQERNAAFTATTGSLSENAAEVQMNMTFLLISSFNITTYTRNVQTQVPGPRPNLQHPLLHWSNLGYANYSNAK